MSPPAIRVHISQPADIFHHLAAQLVFDRHGREFGVEVERLFAGQGAELGRWVDVQARHYTL